MWRGEGENGANLLLLVIDFIHSSAVRCPGRFSISVLQMRARGSLGRNSAQSHREQLVPGLKQAVVASSARAASPGAFCSSGAHFCIIVPSPEGQRKDNPLPLLRLSFLLLATPGPAPLQVGSVLTGALDWTSSLQHRALQRAFAKTVKSGRQSHYSLISFPLDETLVLNTNWPRHLKPAAYLLLLRCVLALPRLILPVSRKQRHVEDAGN